MNDSGYSVMNAKQRLRIRITVAVLAAIALGLYVAFILTSIK